MTNDRDYPPDHLTFSQRHGYEPIPEPMRLEHISDDLRRELWNTVRTLLAQHAVWGDQQVLCRERKEVH